MAFRSGYLASTSLAQAMVAFRGDHSNARMIQSMPPARNR